MADHQPIQFIAYRKPGLKSGRYDISVTQNISFEGEEKIVDSFSKEETLEVAGEKFTLNPAAIHACYPPEGTLGQYQETLPHISLNKVTFPWERSLFNSAPETDEVYPWIGLLILDESEFAADEVMEPEVISLAELEQTSRAKFPVSSIEKWQPREDKLVVLDIRKRLLEAIIPKADELKTLTHVRKRTNPPAGSPSELSVIVSNRLPKGGTNSYAHLVSLENRYDADGHFDFQDTGPTDFIRLVSLKSWSFASPIRFKLTRKSIQHIKADGNITLSKKVEQVFHSEAAIGKIYEGSSAFQQAMQALLNTILPDQDKRETLISKIQPYARYTRSFEQLIEEMDDGTFALPLAEQDAPSTPFIKRGFTALPHKLRQCDQTYSWYRGPLSPVRLDPKFQTNAFPSLPDFGDQLTAYYENIGMFNPSYAMAFQLGKLLAIQDKNFSRKMCQWKYTFNVKQSKLHAQNEVDELLGINDQTEIDEQSVRSIRNWMEAKTFLEDLPFSYLVPDERLLPEESIRFFSLDRHWIECLQYGAFKLGGAIRTAPKASDEQVKALEWNAFKQLTNIYDSEWTGFIMRSQLISGWPDLLIEGYSLDLTQPQKTTTNMLPLAHRELLGPDIMICLFKGNLHMLDLYLKPEGLKFGVDAKSDGRFDKDLQFISETIDIPFKANGINRVLNIQLLENSLQEKLKIKEMSSAHFAMEMLDGSSKGRFIHTSKKEQS